eukprot:8301680-Pyramimonas_sp.AAC.1
MLKRVDGFVVDGSLEICAHPCRYWHRRARTNQSSDIVRFAAPRVSDWSAVTIYPRFLRLIGPS